MVESSLGAGLSPGLLGLPGYKPSGQNWWVLPEPRSMGPEPEPERGHWEEARNWGRQNHIEDLRWRRSPVAEPQNS